MKEDIRLVLGRQTVEMLVKPGGDCPVGWLHGLS